MQHFEEFFTAYLECALWSSYETSEDDSGGPPLDVNHTTEDFDPEALENLRAIARVFYYRNACYIVALIRNGVEPDQSRGEAFTLWQYAGHDLWLTQCGHGAGFWCREHWGCYQDMFTKQAKSLGNVDLMNAGGKIHC